MYIYNARNDAQVSTSPVVVFSILPREVLHLVLQAVGARYARRVNKMLQLAFDESNTKLVFRYPKFTAYHQKLHELFMSLVLRSPRINEVFVKKNTWSKLMLGPVLMRIGTGMRKLKLDMDMRQEEEEFPIEELASALLVLTNLEVGD